MASPTLEKLSTSAKSRQIWTSVLLILAVASMLAFSLSQSREVFATVSKDDVARTDLPLAGQEHPTSDLEILSGHRLLAVIIEERTSPTLIPIMLHFSSVLGSGWTVVLFTLQEHWAMPHSTPFNRAVADGRIEIRFLPAKTSLSNSASVSRFLTSSWLWGQVESAHRVLLFQLDSIICSNAALTVENYLGYDFVGAPIAETYGKGYNGGLSLRNPKLFLQITRESSFDNSPAEFEDQWFYEEAMARLPLGVQLPTQEVARTFSVESIYYEKPLGYHQPARWQAENMRKIETWCPEVNLLIGRRAT